MITAIAQMEPDRLVALMRTLGTLVEAKQDIPEGMETPAQANHAKPAATETTPMTQDGDDDELLNSLLDEDERFARFD